VASGSDDSRERDRERRDQLRAWSAGLDIAVGMFGMGLIGWLIDRWTGHGPWWMLGLGAAGLGGGTYRFIREAMRLNREAARRWARRHPPSGDRGVDVGSREIGENREKGERDASPNGG